MKLGYIKIRPQGLLFGTQQRLKLLYCILAPCFAAHRYAALEVLHLTIDILGPLGEAGNTAPVGLDTMFHPLRVMSPADGPLLSSCTVRIKGWREGSFSTVSIDDSRGVH